MACQWISLCIPVSSTNETDHHDITEALLKFASTTLPLEELEITLSDIVEVIIYCTPWFIVDFSMGWSYLHGIFRRVK